MSQVDAYSGSSYSLVDAMLSAQGTQTQLAAPGQEALDKATAAIEASKKKVQNAYGQGASRQVGQAAFNRALNEMAGVVEAPITGEKVRLYQKDLEDMFSAKVRVDLLGEGVDLETAFSITMTPEGLIQVQCDDAASKQKIENYLAENPKVCEEFGYIQALGNYERARQTTAISGWSDIKNVRAELQASAMEAFFGQALGTTMDYSSLLAEFSNDGSATSFHAGLAFKV